MNRYLILETLASLINSQESLIESFNVLNLVFTKLPIEKIKHSLNHGEPIEKTMTYLIQDNLFLEFFTFYLETNFVDQAILKSVEICRKKDELKNHILKSLIYPAFLLIGLLLFSFVAVFYLQPQLLEFYHSFEIQRTWLSILFLNLLFVFPLVLLIVIGLLSAISIYFFLFLKQQHFEQLERWLKIPLFHQLLKKYYTLKFCLYYKELVKMKYDFKTMCELLSNRIQDRCLKMIVFEFKEQILKGDALEIIIQNFTFFEDYFKTIFTLSLHHQNPQNLLDQYYMTTLMLLETKIKQKVTVMVIGVYGIVGGYIIGIYMGMVMPMMNMLENF